MRKNPFVPFILEGQIAQVLSQMVATMQEMRGVLPSIAQSLQTSVQSVHRLNSSMNELQTTMPETVQSQVAYSIQEVHHTIIEHLDELRQVQQLVAPVQAEPQEVQTEVHCEPVDIQPEPLELSSTAEKVKGFIESELAEGRTPTLSQIVKATGCSKGSASRYRSLLCKESSAS